MASKHIHIGVFIPHGAQTLDVACVDVLGVMSQKYFSALSFIPPAMASTAPDVTVSFITSPSLGGMDVSLTSGVVIKATHLYTNEAVAPGKLDIVVVPGPDPRIDFDKGGLEWLKKQSEVPNVDVLSICTGIFLCAAAGVAEGKSASGPRGMQDVLKARFPGVKFVGEGQRWVQDGNFWSSGMSLFSNFFFVLCGAG
jgi:transcriptional regulator GlxA family with amidase domain